MIKVIIKWKVSLFLDQNVFNIKLDSSDGRAEDFHLKAPGSNPPPVPIWVQTENVIHLCKGRLNDLIARHKTNWNEQKSWTVLYIILLGTGRSIDMSSTAIDVTKKIF